MIREIPILYSTPMVQAKLARRKTQTRRTKGLQNIEAVNGIKTITFPETGITKTFVDASFTSLGVKVHSGLIECFYGSPGDILWGRETWYWDGSTKWSDLSVIGMWWYKADAPEDYSPKWKPSIHMPKIAARIYDRIIDIRVERLQDISEEDAIAEGIEPVFEKNPNFGGVTYKGQFYNNYGKVGYTFLNAIDSYRTLWESINGPGSWDLNPWVWVIVTEQLSTTGRPTI